MKSKVEQFQKNLKELEILAKEIREELLQNDELVTSEIYSIKALLSNLNKEIKDFSYHRLCQK